MNELTFAKQVAALLTKDGAANAFINATEEMRVEMALAFAEAETKRFQNFCMMALTNTEARKEIVKLIKLDA